MPTTYALSVLLTDVQDKLNETIVGTQTADTNTDVTVALDSALSTPYDDDDFINWWCYVIDTTDDAAPEGEERRVRDFTASTGSLACFPGFSAAITASDTFELRQNFARYQYLNGINSAIKNVDRVFPHIASDENVIIQSDLLDYALNSRFHHCYQMWIENATIAVDSTATGGSSTTLDDTGESWSTDQWNDDYAARIYDGPGAGQYATITDTTSTQIVVASWNTYNSLSVVNPTSASEYKIVRIDEEQVWSPLLSVRFDLAAVEFRLLDSGLTTGMMTRIVYARDHTELAATTDTTQVPIQYVRNEAIAYMWDLDAADKNRHAESSRLSELYHLRAEEFIARNPFSHPIQFRFGGGGQHHGWNTYLATPTGPVFRQQYNESIA